MPAPSARPRAGFAALSLGLVLATGCATYSDRTRDARGAAQRGDLPAAEKQVNKLLGTRSSKDMPTKWKKDTALALLERGMILHASGAWKLSARDLSVAEKQLELLDIARDGAGQLGKYVFSDSATKYKAPPSEKLVLNAYNLLNYLLQGDLSGARVEAKRFTVMHEYLTSYDRQGRPQGEGGDVAHPHGAFGSWLAGFVFERLGEHESALRYYDEALQARPFASLVGPVQRLSALAGYRTPRIDAVLGGMSYESAPAPAEIVVVVSVGRVPLKEARRMPIGAAIGLAHAYITGDSRVLERSALKMVVYPELVPSNSAFETAELRVDGQPVGLEIASDIQTEVIDEYEQMKPKIIGAAISRLIVRAAVAEAARAAGNTSEKGGAIIGLFAALAAEGALLAADRPDTRSWTLLPGLVLVARVPVQPGPHAVTVVASGRGGSETRDYSLDIAAGGHVVLDVTTLR
ncbi:hypothetical protein [Nannocystis punicea]|uniref:Tetratricopeptide repeat protein n=1 Tax=Nannocystis punicea TaxID=2995304 RepID=A0ABY7H0A8_9BACT|nr:hypothetical protein [Nannocystis poenicansa]WAS92684.1 hypothetical protein O0S08_41420 [Nannocystis poenicansa]